MNSPVVPIQPRGRPSGGNGGGDSIEGRLRAVEQQLARIEAELRHVATKTWVLGGLLGGMGFAAMLTIAIMKLFL